MVPRAGSVAPDLVADATLGPQEPSSETEEKGRAMVAHAEVRGLPEHLRARFVEGPGESIEQVEFHACDRDWDEGASGACEADTTGQIGSLGFSVANFLDRAPRILAPPGASENFTAVTLRGNPGKLGADGKEPVDFQAIGRIEAISEVIFVNKNKDVMGLRTDAGGGEDFSATVDIEDLDLEGDDEENGRVDAVAKAGVAPFPENLTFCLKQPGLVREDAEHEITTECEQEYRPPLGTTTTRRRCRSSSTTQRPRRSRRSTSRRCTTDVQRPRTRAPSVTTGRSRAMSMSRTCQGGSRLTSRRLRRVRRARSTQSWRPRREPRSTRDSPSRSSTATWCAATRASLRTSTAGRCVPRARSRISRRTRTSSTTSH